MNSYLIVMEPKPNLGCDGLEVAPKRIRFQGECAKLDSAEERAMAELGMEVEMEGWPEY